MKQRTEEWFQARMGKVTASKITDVLAKPKKKGGISKVRQKYMMQIISEILTGKPHIERINSPDIQRGVDFEDEAREAYEHETFNLVQETGFIDHPEVPHSGSSPDGIIQGESGLLEIKCPNVVNHLAFRDSHEIKREYLYQMDWQMDCTGSDWCDFLSYCPELKEHGIELEIMRVKKNQARVDEIKNGINLFNQEIDAYLKKIGVTR